MKFNDDITNSIAATVKDVLEGKAVKKEEVKYPHKMYHPETGEEVEVQDKAGHDKYNKLGYVHEKPKMEAGEPNKPSGKHGQDSGEKDFKDKHKAKKSGEKEDGSVVKEMTISIDEKVKAGKGNAKLDIDYIGNSDMSKKLEKKFNIKLKKTGNSTADVIGKKANIIKFLQSDAMMLDDEDIEDIYPELLEAVKKEGNAFTKALMAARKNGDDTFVVSGKTYKCEDYDDDGKEKEKDVEEAKSKFSKSLLKKASELALKMGGNMTGAVKKIEKMKKGLSDDPEVKAALQLANEEFVSEAESKKEKYQKVFQAALKKFGVKSPGELEGDKKKEFFDYVDKNYDAGENETD